MIVTCQKCGIIYNDENRWSLCPHGPLWAPSHLYCRRCDLVHLNGICPHTQPQLAENIATAKIIDSHTIEGRAFLYHFDFRRFRRVAEEGTPAFAPFVLIGVCWKFRFPGGIKLWIDGKLVVDLVTKEHADAYPLIGPYPVRKNADICLQVADYSRRKFRWFRPNHAHITLEVLEQDEAPGMTSINS